MLAKACEGPPGLKSACQPSHPRDEKAGKPENPEVQGMTPTKLQRKGRDESPKFDEKRHL